MWNAKTNEVKKMKKSEQLQSIYRYHDPAIETEFGRRAMEEIGVIRGLEIDETVNYVLIPQYNGTNKKKIESWEIHKIKKDCNIQVESWRNLEGSYSPLKELKSKKKELKK